MPDIIRSCQLRHIDAENVNFIGIPEKLAERRLPRCEPVREPEDIVLFHRQADQAVF